MIGAPSGEAKQWAIDRFRTFMRLTPIWNVGMVNTDLVEQVPFTPTSKKYQTLTWQANDPLVHYTADDLTYRLKTNIFEVTPPNGSFPSATSNFYTLTDRYEPWGGK